MSESSLALARLSRAVDVVRQQFVVLAQLTLKRSASLGLTATLQSLLRPAGVAMAVECVPPCPL